LQAVYEYAPPSAMGSYQDQVTKRAREAYMKAINPQPALEEEVKVKEEIAENTKRKEAVGEDCPVYVPISSPITLRGFAIGI
jgi:hypothetical protein